jgi:hypothetical protein
MGLTKQIEEAEAQLAALKARAAQVTTCAELGCDMVHTGGKNAGCDLGDDCGCSVPVHECSRCGDSDYGENEWAECERAKCATERDGSDSTF